ncbi:MAG: FecR domain-containing protein [Zavarzinella sp.]
MNRFDDDLLISYLADCLSAEDRRAVEQRLKTDAEFAERCIVFSRNEAIIAEWQRTQGGQSHTFQVGKFSHRLQRRTAPALGAISAAIVLGLCIYLFAFNPKQTTTDSVVEVAPTPIATVEELFGEAFVVNDDGTESSVHVGSSILSGQAFRTDEISGAVLLFPNHRRVEIGTETSVRLIKRLNDAELQVYYGMIFGTEADNSQDPLRVTTPTAVLDVAGSFVSAIDANHTSVEAGSGNVQMTELSSGHKIDIPTGKFAVTRRTNQRKTTYEASPPKITQPERIISHPKMAVRRISIHPNEPMLASLMWDSKLKFFHLDQPQDLREITVPNQKNLNYLQFSPTGDQIAVAGNEKFVTIMDRTSGLQTATSEKYKTDIHAFAYSPDARQLAVGSWLKNNLYGIRFLNAQTAAPIQSVSLGSSALDQIEYSPNGRYFATSERNGQVKLWASADRTAFAVPAKHGDGRTIIDFSPESDLLVSAGRDRTLSIWSIADHRNVFTSDVLPHEVHALKISPNGLQMAVAMGPFVWVYDLRTMTVLCNYVLHRYKVTDVAFSPDGKLVISSGTDGRICLWAAPPANALPPEL